MPRLRYTPSTTHEDTRAIPGLLQTLRDSPPPADGVLSVYLSTPLVPVAGRTYLLSFREGCKTLRDSLAPQAHAAFDRAVARADHHLADAFVPRQPGLALFSSADPAYFFTAPLPWRPAEEFTWASRPVVAPLEAVLDEYERVAVALFDRQRARLFTVFLGNIEESRELDEEALGPEASRSRSGTAETQYAWSAGHGDTRTSMLAGRGGSGQARYARYREDRLLRHARRTGHELQELLRTHPFDRLLLAGPEEALAVLRDELPRPVRGRVAGELSLATAASEADVLRATLAAAEEIERRAERELVDRLLESATTPHAALGFDATLEALSTNRVYHLFIADTFAGVGSECETCGRLVAGPGPCPDCGTPTTPLVDARERITERALEQGAQIETVSGDAAALLMLHGGLGAWTRY